MERRNVGSNPHLDLVLVVLDMLLLEVELVLELRGADPVAVKLGYLGLALVQLVLHVPDGKAGGRTGGKRKESGVGREMREGDEGGRYKLGQ